MWKQSTYAIFLIVALSLIPGGAAHGRFDPVKDPDLVGWWPFDEGSGTLAADASGNGYDGTLSGSAAWVAGVRGTALQFNGLDASVTTGQSLLNDLPGFTMAGWVSADTVGAYSSLFGQNDLVEFGFTTENGGQVGTWMAGNDWAFVGAGDDLAYPSWHHLVLAGDATRIVIYIDGQEQASDEGGMTSGSSSFPFNIGSGVFNATGDWFAGTIDDVWLFGRALTSEEIRVLMEGGGGPGQAKAPHPADEARDILRDVALTWTPGEFAVTHDVYQGATFEDVNNADRANPMGVLVSQGQSETSYDPPGILEFGQTYYWRIDEVNAAPSNTIFKGDVWSFTVEPFAYPLRDIVATTNGVSDAGAGPENTVNGSGLNADDEHSIAAPDMWLAAPGAETLQIRYDFDRVYKLHEMLVWNYNVQFELMLGFGLKNVTVEYSENGTDWAALGDVELAQATATSDYTANTAVQFNGVPARHVRLTVNGGYGPMGQFGLSEVRFMFIPAHARQPLPGDGETDVSVGTILSWRPGREAVSHDVYLGTDADALALIDSISDASYIPGDLLFGSTYYWQIDEVNEADEISVWQGDLWSFATQEFEVIDDCEDYDDEENRIFDTWLDGFTNDTGSTVGYFDAPFAEQTIVNSGRQSMPLEYANDTAPFYSEAERDLGSMNLTTNGANSLRLFVSGQAPAFFEAAGGSIFMNAVGTDIWDVADEFRYAYKNLTGAGSMIARVEFLDGTPSAWAKAGVMIRQSTDGGAVHSLMAMTGGDGNGASWQGRPTENAASVNNDATSAVAPPYWVRIDRAGDTLTGYLSPDGQDWTQLGDARSISMTDPVLIGLALTSHNANQATSAEFSNVSFTGNVTGNWQIAEIGALQPLGNTPESLYMAVEDASGSVVVVNHPDTSATARSGWTEWAIPYSDLAGVDLSRAAKIFVGVGDRDNPIAGGTGTVFIDDVEFGRPAPLQ